MEQDFDNSVFINCPFDPVRVNMILKPIIFCLMVNNLIPILALDNRDGGQLRKDKILELMKSAKYSIHDLSLLREDKISKVARMNMPFELGMDFGLKDSGNEKFATKKFLILGSSRYDYMKAISDLNGFDIQNHGDSTEKVFSCMNAWLSSLGRADKVPPALAMYYDFINFNGWLYSKIINEQGVDIGKDHLKTMVIPEYKSAVEGYLREK